MAKEEIISKPFLLSIEEKNNIYRTITIGEIFGQNLIREEILIYRQITDSEYYLTEESLKKEINKNYYVLIAKITEQ